MKGVTVQEIQRLEDARGWVVWPLSESIIKTGRLSNVHMPQLKPGAIRGNHYHLNTREYALILSGPCTAVFKDHATGEQEQIRFDGEKPTLLRIEPGTIHAFKNEAPHDILLLCYDEKLCDSEEPDSNRRVILEDASSS